MICQYCLRNKNLLPLLVVLMGKHGGGSITFSINLKALSLACLINPLFAQSLAFGGPYRRSHSCSIYITFVNNGLNVACFQKFVCKALEMQCDPSDNGYEQEKRI